MQQEYDMRQDGGELLTAGGDAPTTAEKVGAALGEEKAKPAL